MHIGVATDGASSGQGPKDQAATPDRPPALTIDKLSVSLSGRTILNEVSFTLAPGEFAGLIGSNGTGKTTLLRTILGLQAASSGGVRVGGSARGGNRAVGYVPQKIVFDPELPMSARYLVALGLDGHRLGLPVPSARKRALVEEMLDAVDALHIADARIGVLSGGEQQRILIAHALVRRPSLLLLDEPLANLDIRSEEEVVELVARVGKQQQIAVLISAHDINPLLPVMDRVVYLANGRAAVGTTDEVVRSEVLSALYGSHVDVFRTHNRILVAAERSECTTCGDPDLASAT